MRYLKHVGFGQLVGQRLFDDKLPYTSLVEFRNKLVSVVVQPVDGEEQGFRASPAPPTVGQQRTDRTGGSVRLPDGTVQNRGQFVEAHDG